MRPRLDPTPAYAQQALGTRVRPWLSPPRPRHVIRARRGVCRSACSSLLELPSGSRCPATGVHRARARQPRRGDEAAVRIGSADDAGALRPAAPQDSRRYSTHRHGAVVFGRVRRAAATATRGAAVRCASPVRVRHHGRRSAAAAGVRAMVTPAAAGAPSQQARVMRMLSTHARRPARRRWRHPARVPPLRRAILFSRHGGSKAPLLSQPSRPWRSSSSRCEPSAAA